MKYKILSAIVMTMILFTPAHADARKVRIASHVSALSPLHQQSEIFAKEIEKQLPGQFDFQLFPGGQLGKEKALITNVRAGALEMVNVASGVLKIDKQLGLFDLPWLFDDRAHVQRAMSSGLENVVREYIEKVAGVKVIGVYENGFRHVINAKRAIKVPNDMRGLKIRVSGGKFRQQIFREIGATPQSVAWKETFTALQTGVVDGAEAATYGFYEQKHFEVAKYLSLTRHVYTPSFLLASDKFWNSLTDAQQRVFDKVGREITARAYQEAAKLEIRYLQEMRATSTVNETDQRLFQQKTKNSYTDYISEYGDVWLDMVRATSK